MTKKPVEAFLLKWNRVNLGIVGAWPEPNEKHERLSLFLSILTELNMIVVNIIPQTIFLFQVYTNFELVNESLTLANIPILMELLKLIVIRNRRKDLKKLVASIYDDWNRSKSKMEIELMRSDAEIAKTISITSFIITASAIGSHIFERTFVNSRRAERDRELFYIAYYPYDFLKSPAYEITCFLQCSGASYSFASTIEDTFNHVFLVEMILYSLQLSMQCYNLMLMHRTNTITFLDFFFCLAYIFTILANLFVVCYLGEKLKIAVFKLQYSVYKSKWYNLQTLDAKNLIMLFLKTESPLEITAGKFCVFSYETFAMIIKKSVAILSVFLTMQQKV
ncbi:uncharacterized protein LOC122501183 [Leptopilina heterotoma]|uniref:uncharacterized protein LOC122501183 n=1 Tax=Leptopilina heterotoma TaxID=63436 RepID=UPI001CAA36DA|nr:uncharacterized protein LOC122501183 [Leptopilina heterotoma]